MGTVTRMLNFKHFYVLYVAMKSFHIWHQIRHSYTNGKPKWTVIVGIHTNNFQNNAHLRYRSSQCLLYTIANETQKAISIMNNCQWSSKGNVHYELFTMKLTFSTGYNNINVDGMHCFENLLRYQKYFRFSRPENKKLTNTCAALI